MSMRLSSFRARGQGPLHVISQTRGIARRPAFNFPTVISRSVRGGVETCSYFCEIKSHGQPTKRMVGRVDSFEAKRGILPCSRLKKAKTDGPWEGISRPARCGTAWEMDGWKSMFADQPPFAVLTHKSADCMRPTTHQNRMEHGSAGRLPKLQAEE
jgi:hypothetical protein